ncbi:hypothetical protein HX798_28450 [Pseudomonas putida]|uniref:Uncharacterized protein n=1 Tax=Pseudomonas putida TaxID=303 RepID=A0A7Y8D503_PSEPU|nr:hypothetical protein [Pseudomonas putida]NWC84184.1 hypothetical protein [Pseudomonas putida]
MQDLKFTTENINKLLLEHSKEHIIRVLEQQFERPDLISKTRYKDSAGLPWGEWNKVAALIDNFYESELDYDLENQNCNFLTNLGYFAPSKFYKDPNTTIKLITKLSHNQLCSILSRKFNAQKIVSHLLTIENISITPLFGILVALASTGHHLLSAFEEVNLISKILKFLDADSSIEYMLVSKTLTSRMTSLTNTSKPKVSKQSHSIALLVSGQLRGYKRAVPTICKSLGSNKKVDIFVSTWTDPGMTRINPRTLSRAVSDEAREWLLESHPDLSLEELDGEIRKISRGNVNSNQAESLNTLFLGANSLSISIKDDAEYPFNKMSNSEKMYYHNAYWIETLGKEQFRKYDLIVKIRPDLLLKSQDQKFDSIETEPGTVYCEGEGWVFREWGFGMGDQLIFGSPDDILETLTCHEHESLATRLISDVFKSSSPFHGHINCGLVSWLNGKNCKASAIRPAGISDAEKIDLDTVVSAARSILYPQAL